MRAAPATVTCCSLQTAQRACVSGRAQLASYSLKHDNRKPRMYGWAFQSLGTPAIGQQQRGNTHLPLLVFFSRNPLRPRFVPTCLSAARPSHTLLRPPPHPTPAPVVIGPVFLPAARRAVGGAEEGEEFFEYTAEDFAMVMRAKDVRKRKVGVVGCCCGGMGVVCMGRMGRGWRGDWTLGSCESGKHAAAQHALKQSC